MNFFANDSKIASLVLACALAVNFEARSESAANALAPASARDFYNAGTRLLFARKFDEAEKMFRAALAAQDDQVRPAALYNVGQTRFASGAELLKQGPDAQKATEQGSQAMEAGARAIRQAQSALAENNMDRMVAAYMEGRGARHELREAEKAVSAAMESYGKTLDKWLRADEDFSGVSELNPGDINATSNAEVVKGLIAKLVDSVRKMQAMMGAMGQQKQDLGKLLAKLKGSIPAQNAPPGAAGDDDEDDQGVTPDMLAGQKEGAARQGEQKRIALSPDQARQILNGLSLDGSKRLNMSDKEGKPPGDRKGKNW